MEKGPRRFVRLLYRNLFVFRLIAWWRANSDRQTHIRAQLTTDDGEEMLLIIFLFPLT